MSVVIDLSSVLTKHGVSYEDVARRAALSLRQLEALERGAYKAIRLTTIEKLCHAIGCSPGELFEEIVR